jgi:peptidoglycan/LPS O-acetylase OafA/YrhL
MEPWYDLLAIPAAPFVLGAQVLAAELPGRRARHAVTSSCTAALALMLLVVRTTAPAVDGAQVGAGVLLLALVASLGLHAALLRAPGRPPRRESGSPN